MTPDVSVLTLSLFKLCIYIHNPCYVPGRYFLWFRLFNECSMPVLHQLMLCFALNLERRSMFWPVVLRFLVCAGWVLDFGLSI